MKKIFMLVGIVVILHYALKYYKEFSLMRSKNFDKQLAADQLANEQYLEVTKPQEYEDWEIAANAILDPANLFGFR